MQETGGLIPGSGRSPEEGNGNPLQYSCQGNHMARGALRATVHGIAKCQTQLSNYTTTMAKIFKSVSGELGAGLIGVGMM